MKCNAAMHICCGSFCSQEAYAFLGTAQANFPAQQTNNAIHLPATKHTNLHVKVPVLIEMRVGAHALLADPHVLHAAHLVLLGEIEHERGLQIQFQLLGHLAKPVVTTRVVLICTVCNKPHLKSLLAARGMNLADCRQQNIE